MLTVFLWILLIALTLFLIIIASPLRFKGRLSFHKPDDIEYEFVGSYVHPIVFRCEYSSKDERLRAVLFGFTLKKRVKKEKKTEPADSVNKKPVDSADTEHVTVNEVNIKPPSDVNPKYVGNEGATDQNINDNDTKPAEKPKKKPSIAARVKKLVNAIKSHTAYKLVSDEPLRKKASKWLFRLPRRFFKLIYFDTLKLHVRTGYNDPASLGKLYGYFTAAHSALGLQNSFVDMRMEPVFTEKCLEIDSEISMRTSLSVLLWNTLAVLATFPYLRLYRAVKGKNKNKSQ